MKYKVIEGDLLQSLENKDIDILAHQCNVKLGMGGGIAYQIAKKYPNLEEIDSLLRNSKGTDLLGTSYLYHFDRGIIANVYAQYEGGRCSNSPLDNFNVRLSFLKSGLKQIVEEYPDARIGIPFLASGLAADRERKEGLTDRDYFEVFIYPSLLGIFKTEPIVYDFKR